MMTEQRARLLEGARSSNGDCGPGELNEKLQTALLLLHRLVPRCLSRVQTWFGLVRDLFADTVSTNQRPPPWKGYVAGVTVHSRGWCVLDR